MSAEQVHAQVSDYYGKELQQTSDLKFCSCVCSSAPKEEYRRILAKFAPDVLSKYYGCGSPIPEAVEGLTVLDLGSGTGRDVFLVSVLAGKNGKSIGIDMTDEQLEVANEALKHHMSTFPDAAPVEFRKGFIENLKEVGIEDESVDAVISNCVINLASDKQQVFNEIYRVLKENGEICVSDIFSDRPLSDAARNDRILVGECLGNVMDLMTFMETMENAGFSEIFPTEAAIVPVQGIPPELVDPATVFFKITFSAFKLKNKECKWDDQCAIYNGGIRGSDDKFVFDLNHTFEKGVKVPVCSMLATILSTRYGKYFTIERQTGITETPKQRSFITTIYDESAAPIPSFSTSCCSGSQCCSGSPCCC